MFLTLDIGNTSAKYGLFSGTNLLETGVVSSPGELRKLAEQKAAKAIFAASVAEDPEKYRQALPSEVSFRVLNAQTPVPVKLGYDTPLTLGADRLAAVVGAHYLFPGSDVLVIDAGTCVTTDFLGTDGTYRGGSISPGIDMRFRALHTFTARLPLVQKQKEAHLTGTGTEASIRSGVQNGAIAELAGFVQQYRRQYPDLVVVLCGGDSHFFDTKIDKPIFAVPELVHVGLARIFTTLDV